MTDKLFCPFCNQKLEPIGTSGQFQCGTWGCNASFNFYATRDVWEYIADTKKKLDDLQKDYDLAIQHAKTMTETCLGYKKKLDEIKSDIDEMIAQSHDIGERFAEVVLCNLKNKIKDNDKDVK